MWSNSEDARLRCGHHPALLSYGCRYRPDTGTACWWCELVPEELPHLLTTCRALENYFFIGSNSPGAIRWIRPVAKGRSPGSKQHLDRLLAPFESGLSDQFVSIQRYLTATTTENFEGVTFHFLLIFVILPNRYSSEFASCVFLAL